MESIIELILHGYGTELTTGVSNSYSAFHLSCFITSISSYSNGRRSQTFESTPFASTQSEQSGRVNSVKRTACFSKAEVALIVTDLQVEEYGSGAMEVYARAHGRNMLRRSEVSNHQTPRHDVPSMLRSQPKSSISLSELPSQ